MTPELSTCIDPGCVQDVLFVTYDSQRSKRTLITSFLLSNPPFSRSAEQVPVKVLYILDYDHVFYRSKSKTPSQAG